MGPESDDDTVLRPQRGVRGEPTELDADTVITGRAPVAVPRQPFSMNHPGSTLPHDHSFSVNASAPILLDAPVVIGRRPRLPRVVSGSPPRLVRVPSPLHEVSSTHLELRQQGSHVVVTDLKSTNGTVVVAPGREPLKLRAGESIVAFPGTVVDIGDGNIVEILTLDATQRGER
jgi:hypothetical protein